MELFEAASRLHGADDWAAAAEQYAAALAAFEGQPKREQMAGACLDRRGSCLSMAPGRLEEAVECHSRALELCPEMASAWRNRGEAHMLLGHLKQAQGDLEQALRLELQQSAPGEPGSALVHRYTGVRVSA